MARIRKGLGRGEKGIPEYIPQTGDVLEVRDHKFRDIKRYVVLNILVDEFHQKVQRERSGNRGRFWKTVKREAGVLLINLDPDYVHDLFCISYSRLHRYNKRGLVNRDSQNQSAISPSFRALLKILSQKKSSGETAYGHRISFCYWSNPPDLISKKYCVPKRPSALEPQNRKNLIDAIRSWLRKNREQQS